MLTFLRFLQLLAIIWSTYAITTDRMVILNTVTLTTNVIFILLETAKRS